MFASFFLFWLSLSLLCLSLWLSKWAHSCRQTVSKHALTLCACLFCSLGLCVCVGGCEESKKVRIFRPKVEYARKFLLFLPYVHCTLYAHTQHQQHKEVHAIYQRYVRCTDNTSLYTWYKRWKMFKFYTWSSIPLISFLLPLLLLNNTVLNEVSILELFDIKKRVPTLPKKWKTIEYFFYAQYEFCRLAAIFLAIFPIFLISVCLSRTVHMVSFILIFFISHLSHTKFSRFNFLYFHFHVYFRNE